MSAVSRSSLSAKIGLVGLVALVVGSMIGAGIFSLPQNMASTSGAGALLIAWAITFIGMLSLAFVFQNLAIRQPWIDGGVYGYAKEGFGDYVGFNSAWGYWISAWIGNVSYMVIFFSTLGMFSALNFFREGNTIYAIVGASILLWILHFLILRGIRGAAILNTITTIAKIVPLALFVLLVIFAFKIHTFRADFWGTPALGSILTQVKGCMLVTVWVFVGIEGASMFSSRASSMKSVGQATIIGFFITIALLMAVSLLSLGVLSQAELAKLPNPSMAGVLEAAVGYWGAAFIKVGLLVSVGGAILAWTMLAAETPYIAAIDGTFPKMFAKLNKNDVPEASLWMTNGLIQLFLIWTCFSTKGYLDLLHLATSMILIPYLLCGLFAIKTAWKAEGYPDGKTTRDLIIGFIASVYGVWLIYAADFKYLLLSMLLYAPGLVFYLWAKLERKEKPFKGFELVLATIILVLFAIAVYQIRMKQLIIK